MHVRIVVPGRSYLVYEARKRRTRRFANICAVDALPPSRRIRWLRVINPAGLVAGKALAYAYRRADSRAGSDWRDIAIFLLRFSRLKMPNGGIRAELRGAWRFVRCS